jgi:hypothetical protein
MLFRVLLYFTLNYYNDLLLINYIILTVIYLYKYKSQRAESRLTINKFMLI